MFHLVNMSNRIYFEFPELAQQKLFYGIILFDTYIFSFTIFLVQKYILMILSGLINYFLYESNYVCDLINYFLYLINYFWLHTSGNKNILYFIFLKYRIYFLTFFPKRRMISTASKSGCAKNGNGMKRVQILNSAKNNKVLNRFLSIHQYHKDNLETQNIDFFILH